MQSHIRAVLAGAIAAIPVITAATPAAAQFIDPHVRPDLRVRQFQFVPTNHHGLRIQVANYGFSTANPNTLRLTIRQIDGTPVGRTMDIAVPSLASNTAEWLSISTTGLIPNDEALEDTTFKLNIDADDQISERDETNNEVWHNLEAPSRQITPSRGRVMLPRAGGR